MYLPVSQVYKMSSEMMRNPFAWGGKKKFSFIHFSVLVSTFVVNMRVEMSHLHKAPLIIKKKQKKNCFDVTALHYY